MPRPINAVEQSWLNLAADILQLAIEDARANRDGYQRAKARNWLKSPGARLLFDSLIGEADIDLTAWVLAGCPELGNHDR